MKHFTLGYCTKEADVLDDPDNRRYFSVVTDTYDDAVKQLKSSVSNVVFYELVK